MKLGWRRRTKMFLRYYWKAVVFFFLSATSPFFLIALFAIVAYPGTFSIENIVATCTTLLTVEGFLLALSGLIEKRKERVLPVSIGIVAMMFAVVTIQVGQAALRFRDQYPQLQIGVTTPMILGVSTFQYFVGAVFSFLFMLWVYWLSVVFGVKNKDWWKRKDDETLMY